MKAILTDVDDVLLHWCGGFKKYVGKLGIKPRTDNPHSWNLKEWLPEGVDYMSLIRDFNASVDFERLEAYDDALHGISKLKGMGYKLIAITSCSADPLVKISRMNNLENHFPDAFEALFCLDLGESKEHILRMFSPTWWIEDRFEAALLGAQIGHRSIILTRDHNKEHEHESIIRCHNWHEILEQITG